MKESEEGANKWKDIPGAWTGRINIGKMSNTTQSHLWIQCNPIKIPTGSYSSLKGTSLKVISPSQPPHLSSKGHYRSTRPIKSSVGTRSESHCPGEEMPTAVGSALEPPESNNDESLRACQGRGPGNDHLRARNSPGGKGHCSSMPTSGSGRHMWQWQGRGGQWDRGMQEHRGGRKEAPRGKALEGSADSRWGDADLWAAEGLGVADSVIFREENPWPSCVWGLDPALQAHHFLCWVPTAPGHPLP